MYCARLAILVPLVVPASLVVGTTALMSTLERRQTISRREVDLWREHQIARHAALLAALDALPRHERRAIAHGHDADLDPHDEFLRWADVTNILRTL